MEYLLEGNRAVATGGEPAISARGKAVVILGGGDTGSDCLGTALRQGARSVHQFEILARPPEARDASTPWPLWPLQLRSSHAHEEGGIRDWNLSTTAFEGAEGRVRKLRAQRVSLREGRFTPVAGVPEAFLDAELVLLAMGFAGPERPGLIQELGVTLTPRGAVAVDDNWMTSRPGVFAAGDAARGASLIVWAIAEGRKMAASVDAYISKV